MKQSTKNLPKNTLPNTIRVSIVTVVLNGEDYIGQAIASVNDQTYSNIEHVIVDGLSTDRTVKIIENCKATNTILVSETDDGLYDAMNKGVALATGEVIGILNSDDFYEPDTITKVVSKFEEDREVELVYGALRLIDKSGYHVIEYGSRERLPDWAAAPFNHPTCFVRKSTYVEMGVFDTQFSTASDYDWMLRFKRGGRTYIYLDEVLSNFRLVGVTGGDDKYPLKQIAGVLRKNNYSWFFIVVGLIYRLILYCAKKASRQIPRDAVRYMKALFLPYTRKE